MGDLGQVLVPFSRNNKDIKIKVDMQDIIHGWKNIGQALLQKQHYLIFAIKKYLMFL